MRRQRLHPLPSELADPSLHFHPLLFGRVASRDAADVGWLVGKRREPAGQRRVVYGRGIQLLLDPTREAELLHRLDLSRARSEGQPVERMLDGRAVGRDVGGRGQRYTVLHRDQRRQHENQRDWPTEIHFHDILP